MSYVSIITSGENSDTKLVGVSELLRHIKCIELIRNSVFNYDTTLASVFFSNIRCAPCLCDNVDMTIINELKQHYYTCLERQISILTRIISDNIGTPRSFIVPKTIESVLLSTRYGTTDSTVLTRLKVLLDPCINIAEKLRPDFRKSGCMSASGRVFSNQLYALFDQLAASCSWHFKSEFISVMEDVIKRNQLCDYLECMLILFCSEDDAATLAESLQEEQCMLSNRESSRMRFLDSASTDIAPYANVSTCAALCIDGRKEYWTIDKNDCAMQPTGSQRENIKQYLILNRLWSKNLLRNQGKKPGVCNEGDCCYE